MTVQYLIIGVWVLAAIFCLANYLLRPQDRGQRLFQRWLIITVGGSLAIYLVSWFVPVHRH